MNIVDRKQTPEEQVVWLLVIVGVALRVWQLAGGASLWLDEIALARNIAERNYVALLRPLDYAQVAPPGFLLVERLFWSLLHSDLSLRLVPFTGAIVSLFLMRSLARQTLQGAGVPLAVGMLAVALPHIMFAGQVKQYSTDVTWALALALLTARLFGAGDPPRSRYLLAGVTGLVAVWFSNAAVLVVTGLGASLTLLVLQGRLGDRRRVMGLVVLPWAVGAAAATLAARFAVSPQTMSFMQEFWRGAFAPMPPRSGSDLLWPWYRLTSLFGTPWGLRYRLASVYVLLALAGLVVLWRSRRDLVVLMLGPLVVTFAVAAAHRYPFEGRVVLYLTPFLMLAIAAGVAGLAAWLGARIRFAGAAVVLLAAFVPLERIVKEHPTYRLQEMRILLEQLAVRRRPGDVVYVWYRAMPNVIWYGPRNGLPPGEVIEGGCWMTAPRRFLADVDRLRGRPRAWIVLTGSSLAEAKLMLAYADRIGIRRDTLTMTSSFPRYHLDAWLYDFSDSTRLASTSAETFPVSLPTPARAEVMACSAFFGQ